MRLHGREIRIDYSFTEKAHEPTPGTYMGRVTYPPPPRRMYFPRYDPYERYDRGYDSRYDRERFDRYDRDSYDRYAPRGRDYSSRDHY